MKLHFYIKIELCIPLNMVCKEIHFWNMKCDRNATDQQPTFYRNELNK